MTDKDCRARHEGGQQTMEWWHHGLMWLHTTRSHGYGTGQEEVARQDQ